MRPSRSDQELAQASALVAYEVNMLMHAADAADKLGHYSRRSSGLGQEEQIYQNALLESFGIHARNLRHFLYARPGGGMQVNDTDVLATDFDSTWNEVEPPLRIL